MDYDYENERAWYVIQSYSGCENAAKVNLERRIKSMNMENYIFQVLIPETVRYEKKKNGEMKEIVEKQFPGYIFVDMIVTDESWFIVRNTPMVTGFLGSSGGGAKPVPLLPEEIIHVLLLSLNRGDSSCITDRVMFAEHQYEQLVENGIRWAKERGYQAEESFGGDIIRIRK